MGIPNQSITNQIAQTAKTVPVAAAPAPAVAPSIVPNASTAQAALANKQKALTTASTPAAPKTYDFTNPYYAQGYTSSVAKGTKGEGGAQFGMGAGGNYRFDYTNQNFAGLWSQGIDYKDKNAANAVQQWYDAQPANVKSEVDSYWKNNKKSGNAAVDMMRAVDWRTRDVARKIQKENGFLDSTFGQIISTLGQVALGAVPGIGPALSAGLGAITGGLQGGIGGALLGGLGGYGAGNLGSSLATNGIGGTISNAVSGFNNFFGTGGAPISTPSLNPANVVQGVGGAVNAAANAVPGLSSGVNAASLAASLGPTNVGSAAGLLPAGAGGISTAAGAGLGATAAQAAGSVLGSTPTGGGAATTTSGTTATGTGAAPISTPSATAGNTVAGVGGSTLGGTSAISTILGALGGTGGLGSSALNLLQGVLGQMNSGDLDKIAAQMNQTNQNLTNMIPPISYRDSILNNLDMIMNRPGQLMEQGPYKDYMDYTQRAVERKMVSQGYGGVGQSTNTADAVSRAVMESMSGIVQNDRQIATQQLLPFFNVGVEGATNMNGAILQQAANAQNAGNTQNIITGAAGILKSIFD